MELIDIYNVVRRHVRMIVTLVLVATLVGYGASFLLTKRYTAVALVLVRPQQAIKLDAKTTSKEFLDFPLGQSAVETPSKTYIEIIKSPDFIGQLVRKLELDAPEKTKSGFLSKILPASMQPAVDDLKKLVKNSVTFLRYGRVIPEDPFADAVKGVQDSLVLEARPDTYIFTISYTAKEPGLAANVANAAAKLLVDYMEKARQSESLYARDKLRSQLIESRQELENARVRLEAYKNANSIFLYETEYQSKLKVIADLQMELSKADQALASLKAVATQSSTSSLSLIAKRDSIVSALKERQAELVPLPAMERELKQLQLVEKTALADYEAVNNKFHEAEINNFNSAREVQPVADAVPPKVPSSPNQPIIALVSLLSGLVVGIGLAFLLEYLNRRIRGIQDVEDFVGVKVLATIPRVFLEPLVSGAARRRTFRIMPS